MRGPLLLAAGVLLGSLTASSQETLGAKSATHESTTVLRFVSWKPDNPHAWDEALARFTEAYPRIRVVREIAPHSSTAFHDLLTQKLKNHDPTVDLFLMDVVWVSEFAAAGWALPLDSLFPPSERIQFLPNTIEAGSYQGQVYGVPLRIDSGMLYYRADLLRKYGFEPPQTWEELARQADIIVEGEAPTDPGLRGYSGQFKQYEGLVCNMLEFIGSRGGQLISHDGRQSALATPESLASVRFVRDHIIRRLASRAVLTYQEPESLAVFVQGKAVFHRNWPYAWEVANNAERSAIAGKVGIAPLPRFPGGPSVAALGGWLYGISAYSQHQNEAWQFISFFSSHEMQKFFAIKEALAPSRTALYSDQDVLKAAPQFRDQFAVFQAATPRPRTPVYPAVSHILQRYFSRALAFADVDLEAEATSADRQINRLLRLTGESF